MDKVIQNQISLIPSLSLRGLLKTKEQKQKEKCLEAIQDSAIINFLGITDINENVVNTVIDDVLSIRDDQKILLTTILLNRWFYLKENDAFVKHIPSKTKNVLYQIIIGNGVWDGVYEFSLKGIDVLAKGYADNSGEKILEICSPGNYDTLEIESKNVDDILCLTRFDLDDEFEKYLLKNKFLTKKELEKFTAEDTLGRNYLIKKTPKMKIS